MKINGMIRAAHALGYLERRQEVVANNLANVNTDGFRGERVFARMMGDALPVADTATDRRAGTLRPTGNPLDLALDGDAFLVVQTADGERLGRGGSFRLDEQGRIADMQGNLLLGRDGPIVPGPGTLAIDGHGVVTVDGAEVARLRIETVPADVRLQHDAGTLFLPDPARTPADPASAPVRQGMLEESNVNSVGAMIDMISIQRAYSAVQKAMTTLDGVRSTIANDIGRPV